MALEEGFKLFENFLLSQFRRTLGFRRVDLPNLRRCGARHGSPLWEKSTINRRRRIGPIQMGGPWRQ
jgi:hypothetical protein